LLPQILLQLLQIGKGGRAGSIRLRPRRRYERRQDEQQRESGQ